MSCPLCEIFERNDIQTKVYYQEEDFIILDCGTCKIPMVVYQEHGEKPPERRLIDMRNRCRALFGKDIAFRMEQREIHDHFHFHVLLS